MSLDLTRAEIADRISKCKKRPITARTIPVVVAVLIFASQFGYVPKAAGAGVQPYPITCYPACKV